MVMLLRLMIMRLMLASGLAAFVALAMPVAEKPPARGAVSKRNDPSPPPPRRGGYCPGPTRTNYPTGTGATATSSYTTTTSASTSSTSCDVSLCVDFTHSCGMYGGCYLIPECGGTSPTSWAIPTCTSTSTTATTTPCDMHICADYVNECGIWYGGCFLAPECGGIWPDFPVPPCPCSSKLCWEYNTTCVPEPGQKTCFLEEKCGGPGLSGPRPPCTTVSNPADYVSIPGPTITPQ